MDGRRYVFCLQEGNVRYEVFGWRRRKMKWVVSREELNVCVSMCAPVGVECSILTDCLSVSLCVSGW